MAKDKAKKTTLIPTDIATQAYKLFQFHIENDAIADIIGVSSKQFKSWIEHNIPANLERRTTGVEKGDKTTERIGFKELRARARATLEVTMLSHLNKSILGAMAANQYSSAISGSTWFLEKAFPKKYGSVVERTGNDDDGPRLIKSPLRTGQPASKEADKNNE